MKMRSSNTSMKALLYSALLAGRSIAFQLNPNGKNSAYEKAIIASQEEASLPALVIPDDDTSLNTRHYIENIADRSNKPILALPLNAIGMTDKVIPTRRNTTARTFFGLDDMPTEYWYDNRIHTFGNSGGLWPGIHALVAPLATRIIDDAAYDGINAREMVSNELQSHIFTKPNICVLDLCCGVGMSTRALSSSFKDAQYVLGVDTSPEMVLMARFIAKYQRVLRILSSFQVRKNVITDFVKMIVDIQIALTSAKQNQSNIVYSRGNAERVNVPMKTFDLVTIMYAFHEIPFSARYRILREARRLLKDGGVLAVVDIHDKDYTPSAPMLAGEPYVLEYQMNISHQMDSIQGFVDKKVKDVIPGHVKMWVMTRQR